MGEKRRNMDEGSSFSKEKKKRENNKEDETLNGKIKMQTKAGKEQK